MESTHWLSQIIVVLKRGISWHSARAQSRHLDGRYQLTQRYAQTSTKSLSTQYLYTFLTAHW